MSWERVALDKFPVISLQFFFGFIDISLPWSYLTGISVHYCRPCYDGNSLFYILLFVLKIWICLSKYVQIKQVARATLKNTFCATFTALINVPYQNKTLMCWCKCALNCSPQWRLFSAICNKNNETNRTKLKIVQTSKR